MKLLLITEIFPPIVGGSGRWFLEIYSRLKNFDSIIAAGDAPGAELFDKSHVLTCIRLPIAMKSCGVLSLYSLRKYWCLFRRISNLLKRYNNKAIHCGRGLPEGLIAYLCMKLSGIPYLCYIHGEELPAYHSSREYRLLSKLVYSNAALIIVNSRNTQRSVVQYTGISDSIRVMHPGVDTDYFKPAYKNDDVSRELGWENKKIMLTVGRLQKRKGHDHVIMALAKIREHVQDVLYAIVGDGEERPYLEQVAHDCGVDDIVQFLGKVDDAKMLVCYQQCDLFVLANREVDGDFEGFGMVLLEAQACGKPVVAGNSGGTVEAMLSGETGLLVDANSPDAIGGKVIALLSDEARRTVMGHRAVEWVRSNFDWNVLVHQAESIFSELVGTR